MEHLEVFELGRGAGVAVGVKRGPGEPSIEEQSHSFASYQYVGVEFDDLVAGNSSHYAGLV